MLKLSRILGWTLLTACAFTAEKASLTQSYLLLIIGGVLVLCGYQVQGFTRTQPADQFPGAPIASQTARDLNIEVRRG
jgi:hypothetical protein